MKIETYNIIWCILAAFFVIIAFWHHDFLYGFWALVLIDIGCCIQKYLIKD